MNWQMSVPGESKLLSGHFYDRHGAVYVQGEMVVFQYSEGCVAFQTQPQMETARQLAWYVTGQPDSEKEFPPRQGLQVTDKLAIEFMGGAISNGVGPAM